MNAKEKYAESMNALNAAMVAFNIAEEVVTELNFKLAEAEDAAVDADEAYTKASEAHQRLISELPANFFIEEKI